MTNLNLKPETKMLVNQSHVNFMENSDLFAKFSLHKYVIPKNTGSFWEYFLATCLDFYVMYSPGLFYSQSELGIYYT